MPGGVVNRGNRGGTAEFTIQGQLWSGTDVHNFT